MDYRFRAPLYPPSMMLFIKFYRNVFTVIIIVIIG